MPRRPTLKETIQAALAGYAHELVVPFVLLCLPVDLPEVWVETRRSTPAGIRALLSTCNPVRLTP